MGEGARLIPLSRGPARRKRARGTPFALSRVRGQLFLWACRVRPGLRVSVLCPLLDAFVPSAGCDVGGRESTDIAGTGLISRATAEMLREKHDRRKAGVAGGTQRRVEALPVPVPVPVPSPPALGPSPLAARANKEASGGANKEADDEAAARTGKVRAAARRSHFTQSLAGQVIRETCQRTLFTRR